MQETSPSIEVETLIRQTLRARPLTLGELVFELKTVWAAETREVFGLLVGDKSGAETTGDLKVVGYRGGSEVWGVKKPRRLPESTRETCPEDYADYRVELAVESYVYKSNTVQGYSVHAVTYDRLVPAP